MVVVLDSATAVVGPPSPDESVESPSAVVVDSLAVGAAVVDSAVAGAGDAQQYGPASH